MSALGKRLQTLLHDLRKRSQKVEKRQNGLHDAYHVEEEKLDGAYGQAIRSLAHKQKALTEAVARQQGELELRLEKKLKSANQSVDKLTRLTEQLATCFAHFGGSIEDYQALVQRVTNELQQIEQDTDSTKRVDIVWVRFVQGLSVLDKSAVQLEVKGGKLVETQKAGKDEAKERDTHIGRAQSTSHKHRKHSATKTKALHKKESERGLNKSGCIGLKNVLGALHPVSNADSRANCSNSSANACSNGKTCAPAASSRVTRGAVLRDEPAGKPTESTVPASASAPVPAPAPAQGPPTQLRNDVNGALPDLWKTRGAKTYRHETLSPTRDCNEDRGQFFSPTNSESTAANSLGVTMISSKGALPSSSMNGHDPAGNPFLERALVNQLQAREKPHTEDNAHFSSTCSSGRSKDSGRNPTKGASGNGSMMCYNTYSKQPHHSQVEPSQIPRAPLIYDSVDH